MELIVNISEEEYRECKFRKDLLSLGGEPTDLTFNMRIETIIANGTELPKGHGRLIDADELKKHKYHDNNRFENAVAVAQIDWADTIIEADKENEK